MTIKNFAHLIESSPFYTVFPDGIAPIKNTLVPNAVKLIGDEETKAYMLDVEKCTAEQLDKIAELVAKQCGGTKIEVLDSIKAGIDMPIRASQVSGVSTDSRAVL